MSQMLQYAKADSAIKPHVDPWALIACGNSRKRIGERQLGQLLSRLLKHEANKKGG
jgi:hypothetical protein